MFQNSKLNVMAQTTSSNKTFKNLFLVMIERSSHHGKISKVLSILTPIFWQQQIG